MRGIRKFLSVLLVICLLGGVGACNTKEEKAVVNTNGMNEFQKAVVATAESFYLRGNCAQYDMGHIYDKGYGGSMERRVWGVRAPEDYTAQSMSYTDCSAFVFDVYYEALGIKIIGSSPWTKTYCESTDNTVLREKPEEWADGVEVEAKLKEFADALQPGDIIVYRYTGNTGGHAMLYVGNGMMIHSGGASFNFEEGKEKYEENGTFLYEPIADSLLKPGHRRYLAEKPVYVIIRPLEGFKGEIPKTTLSRMNEMRGIKAEKLASHTYGQSVNPNEEITFTFRLKNHSNLIKELTILDTVPENTEYISGCDEQDGNKLSWEVTVPPSETVEVSYKVKVSPDAIGKTIHSESSVSEIKVNCPEILVAKTLNKEQQQDLKKAIETAKTSSKTGTMLANEIYGKEIFTMEKPINMWDEIIDPWSITMGEGLKLSDLVVPYLYGGRKVGELDKESQAAQKRTRYMRKDLLVVGDVIAIDEDLYIFTGDKLFDLNKKTETETVILENIIAADCFVVLRPSFR